MKQYTMLAIAVITSLIYFSCGDEIGDEIGNNLGLNLGLDIDDFQLFDCAECTHIIDEYETNGEVLGLQPGDILCLDTNSEYGNLLFNKIKGSASNPIIIRNCGGIVTIKSSVGVKFIESDNFIITGDGAETAYGIKISTDNNFFLSMEQFTTDFEISRLEIAGNKPNGVGDNSGFAGIGVKTSPYQACDVFTDPTRQAWIMRNISIHDNYIHDTGGEGLYIGHGFYDGRIEADCSEITYSHSIKNLRVFNNIVENVGQDGIQVKNADETVEVYNNYVFGYGNRNLSGHNEGMLIGAGTVGKFYNNIIVQGSGNGIQIQARGNLDVFNNVVINSGESGIYAAGNEFGERLPDGYFNIMNNTVVNSAVHGFVFFSETGGTKRVMNNIIAGSLDELTRPGASLDSSNNIVTQNVESLLFNNLSNYLIQLSPESPAIDKGTDLSSFGVTFDIEGNLRPRGASFDVGAHESQ